LIRNHDLPYGKRRWPGSMISAELMEVALTQPVDRERQARIVAQMLLATGVRFAEGHSGKVQATCLIAQEIEARVGSSRSCGGC
jgi:hypothetical protein